MTSAVATIPISAEDLLELIKTEAFRLRYSWMSFKLLFAGERENVDVLNATGPGVFGMLQRLLFDDTILQISRITDPAGNRRQENATLKRLMLATEWDRVDPTRFSEFMSKANAVDTACADCRKHRNKRISHRDLAWSTKALTLPDGTIKMIDCAVDAIEGFIREFNFALHPGVEQSFEIMNGDWDVKHLIGHLKNRASIKLPDVTPTVSYVPGSTSATLNCPYCGRSEDISFYLNGRPTPRRMVRRHYDECWGVVGHESLAVELVDVTGTTPIEHAVVDLRIPTRDTDA